MIAACGIIVDTPVLIVGAMVIGPDFGPVAALCVALVKFRAASPAGAGGDDPPASGLAVASVVAVVVLTLVFRATGLVDRGLRALRPGPHRRSSPAPTLISVVVALAAGVAGMLTVTEDRAGALVGVLVSVTTIPAAANIGVAVALGNGDEAWGSVGSARR